MRIGIFSEWIGTYAGGPEIYQRGLLYGLAEVDRTNQYAVYYTSKEGPRTMKLNGTNFEHRVLRPVNNKWIQVPISLPWELWRKPVDLLHVTFTSPPIMPRKSVYSLQCWSPFCHPEFYPPAIRWRLAWAFERGSRMASMVICISNYIRDNLLNRFRLDPERVFTIYCGVEPDFALMEDKERVRERLKRYGVDGPFILYVGKVQNRKNSKRLIQAYNMLKQEKKIEHKLVLAGKKTWDQNLEADALIQQFGLQNEVLHIDPLPRAELPYFYNGADLFVFPSICEGFGLPPLEAMACGTPVVTSNCTSLPEVVDDAALLVDPYKVEDIASAMYEIIRDEDLKARLSRKGLERAKMFTWEKAAAETLEVYRKVC